MSAWKPGDVAMVEWPRGTWRAAVMIDSRSGFAGHPRSEVRQHWQIASSGCSWLKETSVIAVRPLVVINPESDDADRLADMLTQSLTADDVSEAFRFATRAALREFAKPTPPKCSAHGDEACPDCSRIAAVNLTSDAECRGCEIYGVTGMHWDTCPYRIRGGIFATRADGMSA